MKTSRSIFREHAIAHYLHRRRKDVLPNFINPTVFLLLWFLLGLLVVVMALVVPGLYGLVGG